MSYQGPNDLWLQRGEALLASPQLEARMIRVAALALAILAPVGGAQGPVVKESLITPLPSPQLATWRLLVRHAAPQDAGPLYRIAYRESRFRPDARNRRSSAAGTFQFIRSTWDMARKGAGLPPWASPYHPEDATKAAAWLYAQNNGPRHWGPR